MICHPTLVYVLNTAFARILVLTVGKYCELKVREGHLRTVVLLKTH